MIQELAPFEKRFIANRLKIYKLPYAEVYDEVYDHMLSACEQMRKQGDPRPVLLLFQEIINQDFNGHAGFEVLLNDRKETIKSALYSKFKIYFREVFISWRAFFLILTTLVVFALVKLFHLSPASLLMAICAMTVLPVFYWFFVGMRYNFFRTITSKRKKSLVNAVLFELLSLPVVLFSVLLNLLNLVGVDAISEVFRNYAQGNSLEILSLFMALCIHAFWVFIKVFETEYKQLIYQVIR